MNSFDIKYSDGTVDKVKRVKRDKLKDLIELQQEIIYYFLKSDLSVGVTISHPEVWSAITKIASLLLIVGNDKPGIKLELIEDDYEQLTQIFITSAEVDENGEFVNPRTMLDSGNWYEPSLVSKLHQLNYKGDSFEAIKKLNPEVPEAVA